ncbi:hypothetical protein CA85_40550 [Allorhodopirellula solitaria]|uniref:Uncharacterized protein n=1 Tax=Allorhodopirellula solitaria TaxID=2527987 RepID=A0A5C5X2V3_9BACT|nr:hypothetical protein CA85_40550 [Allorhodopirellula solitaria]
MRSSSRPTLNLFSKRSPCSANGDANHSTRSHCRALEVLNLVACQGTDESQQPVEDGLRACIAVDLPKLTKQFSSFEGLISDSLGYAQLFRDEREVLVTLLTVLHELGRVYSLAIPLPTRHSSRLLGGRL